MSVPFSYPGEHPRYFSHLEHDHCRIETDIRGRILSVEFRLPRSRWQIATDSAGPDSAIHDVPTGELYILEFRAPLPVCETRTNENRDWLRICFETNTQPGQLVRLSPSVTAVFRDGGLAGLILTGIETDRGGKRLRHWREQLGRGNTPQPKL